MRINSVIKAIFYIFFIAVYFWWSNLLSAFLNYQFLPQPRISYSNVDVLKYSMNIELFPSIKKIKADNEIIFKTPQKVNHIKFDFSDSYKISDLKLNKEKVKFFLRDNILEITLAERKSLIDTLKISYSGFPSGLYGLVFKDETDETSIYSINEPSYARDWFPCNDNPSDKAFVEMKITNDSNYVSVSNGNLIEKREIGKRRQYYWKSNFPISCQYITLYSAKYLSDSMLVSYNNKNYHFNIFLRRNNFLNGQIDFENAAKTFYYLIEEFGDYPFQSEKIGMVEIDWKYGAIENQTAIGIGKNFITGDSRFLSMYIHELAHAWFGNSVGIKSWKDTWLLEGFATYAEIVFAEKYFYDDKKNFYELLNSFSQASFSSSLFNPSVNIFDRFVYEKGARVFRMLEYEIGKTEFRNILKQFFVDYKFKCISTEEFQNYIEVKSNKNLESFFNQWVYNGVGFPVFEIRLTKNRLNKSNKLKLKITQLQNDYQPYKLSLEIAFYDNELKRRTIKKYFINSRKTLIIEDFNFDIKRIIPDPEKNLLAKFILIQ